MTACFGALGQCPGSFLGKVKYRGAALPRPGTTTPLIITMYCIYSIIYFITNTNDAKAKPYKSLGTKNKKFNTMRMNITQKIKDKRDKMRSEKQIYVTQ